ncbi:CsiV family protein [Moritella sp. Urea-trap-13]|uniref:CsiV family protein n=1 Tax=Moritella sp. Urea-trap-13 TaxID=2058327 RepID=UPI000C3397D7|nr:CsiV family protein [Moritella sp. Urea-trap-13]PKH06239.1 hypothetical protein CXF93_09945 [Moritella sp. Urea-trap-13]
MKKSLISLLVGLSLGSSFAVNAADEERWFEVEVILFERNIDPAKVIEHWDQSSYPTYSKQNKDPMALFINDDNLITSHGSNDNNERGLANESNVITGGQQPTLIDDSQTLPVFGSDRDESLVQDTNTNVDIIKATNVVIDGANLKEDAKDPTLQIVPASELQLTEQFNALNNHANYNVVLHSAWRMQPQDRNAAIPIRLFAGQNYQQQYKQNGDAIVRTLTPAVSPIIAADTSPELAVSVSSTVGESNIIDLDNTTTIDDGVSVQKTNTQAGNTLAGSVAVTPPVPATPVWKIDGELTIYLEHYLYAKTDLFVRKEGTRSITAEDIIASESQPSDLAPNVENIDLLELLGIHLEPKATGHTELTLNNANVNVDPASEDFEIENIAAAKTEGDNALTDENGNPLTVEETNIVEPQDKTIPVLNSYPMQQLRVIRSGEIHYLDHPMFGMLIQIRKYEPPMLEETIETAQ